MDDDYQAGCNLGCSLTPSAGAVDLHRTCGLHGAMAAVCSCSSRSWGRRYPPVTATPTPPHRRTAMAAAMAAPGRQVSRGPTHPSNLSRPFLLVGAQGSLLCAADTVCLGTLADGAALPLHESCAHANRSRSAFLKPAVWQQPAGRPNPKWLHPTASGPGQPPGHRRLPRCTFLVCLTAHVGRATRFRCSLKSAPNMFHSCTS